MGRPPRRPEHLKEQQPVPMQHHTTPIYDDHWEGTELAADDTYRYLWIWQGSNIRLIAVPKNEDSDWAYDHAWCFPRDPELVARAVADWNPDTQDEPNGWHKRPTQPARRAPRREEEPEYNRPRCVHGCYLADGCRTVNCPEAREHRAAQEGTAHGETPDSPVHSTPPVGSGLTPCCHRTPFELPRTDRMSNDPALVTCRP